MAKIEVKDKYVIQLELSGNEFPGVQDLKRFAVTQKAGGGLPVFEIKLNTANKDFVNSLSETTEIKALIGRSIETNDFVRLTLRVQKFEFTKFETEYFSVIIKGIIGSPRYLSHCAFVEFFDGSSKDALAGMGKYLNGVKDSAAGTKDEQIWIKHTIPPIKFVHDVTMHSYISENDALLVGVDLEGKLNIKSIQNEISKAGQKKFVWYQPQSSNEFLYNQDYKIKSPFGLLNNMGVYLRYRELPSIIDKEEWEYVSTPGKQKFLTNNKLNIIPDEPFVSDISQYLHDYVHEKYWEAYYNNISKYLLLSSFVMEVELFGEYVPLELFEVIYFEDYRLETKGSEIPFSGFYMITEISYVFDDGVFFVNVIMSREAANT